MKFGKDSSPYIFVLVVSLTAFFILANNNYNVSTTFKNVLSDIIKYDNGISQKDKKEYSVFAYSILNNAFGKGEINSNSIPEIKNYDLLFVSFINQGKLRCSQGASNKADEANRTRQDIIQAIENCINDERFGGKIAEDELSNLEIVFDIMYNRRPTEAQSTDMEKLNKEIELGIHALEIKNGEHTAYFKASVPVSHNYNLEKTLEELCKKAKLSQNCAKDRGTELYKYDSTSFLTNKNDDILDLYRYNNYIELDEIDNEMLLDRINLTKSWFLNNINKKLGILQYRYYPSIDKYSSQNSHARQLATIWAMAELENEVNDSSLDNLISDSLDFYLKHAVFAYDYAYVKIDDDSKLANNAFVILSLIKTPKYDDQENWLKLLAKGILYMQNEDGSYKTHFASDDTSGENFYPGEAMLSLMRLYEATSEEKYLYSVNNAFTYYKKYWQNNKNTAFIPWHSQAYYLLYNETGDEEILDFIFEMNDWLIDNHQIFDDAYIDKIGGFPKVSPSGCSTAVYLEGLNDAYLLAKSSGDEFHMSKYKESITLGARFLLLTQYTNQNSFYLSNPDRAIGGFKQSLWANAERIDYTQHALRALIKVYKNDIFN
ncbi:AMMECR1 domain-containing protein [Patescibacteria group bacterium]|nr:AMMECR1 domain-containing protein [Patescibacteria group bacterium]MBU1895443.1 AMMECR1 domain-containing protein [Patescibacteria group bacterium]